MLTVPLFIVADLDEERKAADSLLSKLVTLKTELQVVQEEALNQILLAPQSSLLIVYGNRRGQRIAQHIQKNQLTTVKLAIICPPEDLPELRALDRTIVLSLLDASLPVEALVARIRRLHERLFEVVEQEQANSKPSTQLKMTPSVFATKGNSKQPLTGPRIGSIRRDISSLMAINSTLESDSPKGERPDSLSKIASETISTFTPISKDVEPPATPIKRDNTDENLKIRLKNRAHPSSISRVLLLESNSHTGEKLVESMRFLGLQVQVVSPQPAQTNWALLEKFRPHLLVAREHLLGVQTQVWLQLFAAESRLVTTPLVGLPSTIDSVAGDFLALRQSLTSVLPPIRDEEAAISESPRRKSPQSFHEELDPLQALEEIEENSQSQFKLRQLDSSVQEAGLLPGKDEQRQRPFESSEQIANLEDLLSAELENHTPENSADEELGGNLLSVAKGDTFSTVTKDDNGLAAVDAAQELPFWLQGRAKRLLEVGAALSLILAVGFFFMRLSAHNERVNKLSAPPLQVGISSATIEAKEPTKNSSKNDDAHTAPLAEQTITTPQQQESLALAPSPQNFLFTPESDFTDCSKYDLTQSVSLSQRKKSSAAWAKSRKQIVQGDLKKAQEFMCLSVALNPRSYAVEGLARLYLMADAPTLALKWLERGLTLRPREENSLQLRSDIYNRLGEPEKALSDLLTLLKLPAADQKSRSYISRKYSLKAAEFFKLGDLHQGEVWYRRSFILDELNSEAAGGLALIYAKRQLFTFADHWGHLALKRDEKSAVAHLALAESARQTGDYLKAQKELEQVAVTEPNHRLLRRYQRRLEKSQANH